MSYLVQWRAAARYATISNPVLSTEDFKTAKQVSSNSVKDQAGQDLETEDDSLHCAPEQGLDHRSTLQTPACHDVETIRAQREDSNLLSGLLRLSPELRNKIYNLTIPTTTRISIVSKVSQNEISLLQLCRFVRTETVPIFYGNTTFTFDLRTRPNFQRAKAWLEGLSPDAVKCLRKIYVQSDVNCYCKDASKNEKPTHLNAWVDMDGSKWSQSGYSGCKCCSSQEGAKDVVWKIQQTAVCQDVRKEDLFELLEILRPIRAFDFSFQVAKDGEGSATFDARARVFGTGIPGAKGEDTLVIRPKKQPRTQRRSGARRSDAALSPLVDQVLSLETVDKWVPEVSTEDLHSG